MRPRMPSRRQVVAQGRKTAARFSPSIDIIHKESNSKIKIGKFYDVVINDYDEYDLFGDILLKEGKEK